MAFIHNDINLQCISIHVTCTHGSTHNQAKIVHITGTKIIAIDVLQNTPLNKSNFTKHTNNFQQNTIIHHLIHTYQSSRCLTPSNTRN